MNNGIRIAFDLDDVLIDLITSWLNTLNERFGTNKKQEDITNWSISNFFKDDIEKGLLTKNDIYSPLIEDDFWKIVKPIDGMHDMLLTLKKLGNYDMYIVTASNYTTIKSKLDNCIMKYYGDIFTEDKIIVCKNKYMINANILVDDYFGNIDDFLKYNPDSFGIIRDTSHSNIDYDAIDNSYLHQYNHLTRLHIYDGSHDLLANILNISNKNFKR